MRNNRLYSCFVVLMLLLLFIITPIFSQHNSVKIMLTGKVVDAVSGKPLAGISIADGGLESAISNNEGEYMIHVSSENSLLEIKGSGYTQRDIPVRGRNQIDIVLYEENYKGARKTVNTNLGELSSSKLAFAYDVVRENNEISVSVASDVLLQGYTGGLNTILRSGTPGSTANIYLRGFNSMLAGNQPLFVIDGLPIENTIYASSKIDNYYANPLANIDVKDIESVTVMKDATSLYGLKGANGVIMINTLRTHLPETKINAHMHTGITFEPDKLPLLNASNYRNLISGISQTQINDPQVINSLPYFDNRKPVLEKWGYEGNVDYYRYNHNTDWQDYVYQSKLNQNYYLNVSGGDDIALYMLSIGFLDQQGTVNNNRFTRFNTRFNSSIRLLHNLDFLSNMSFVYGTKNPPNEGANFYKNPMFASFVKSPITAPYFYNEENKVSPNVEDVDVFGHSNPHVLANDASLLNINYNFMGSFQLKWNILRNLEISNFLGLNFNKEREKTFYPSVGVALENLNENEIINQSQHRVDRLLSLYNDLYVNYKPIATANHKLNLRTGVRYQTSNAENDFGEGFNSSSDEFKSIQYGQALLRQVGGSLGTWKWLSAYITADYLLNNKFIFNLMLSNDASSRTGKEGPTFFTYPSVAAAWLLSHESFLQEAEFIDLLKLRASYGLSGNDNLGNFTAFRYYEPQNFLGTYGLIRGNLVNTTLRPETVRRINLGIDLSIFNERFNIGVDVYSNRTSDVITNTAPNRFTGFTDYIDNGGVMANVGFDLSINTRIINKTVKWDLGTVLSHYQNTVKDLKTDQIYTNVLGATILTAKGNPMGLFYGYKTDGVYATQSEADAADLVVMKGLVAVPFEAGDVRFVNTESSDNVIDEKDRVVIGDPNPTLFGSLLNNFSYKQWKLNTMVIFSLGNDVFNYTRSQLENMSSYNNQLKTVQNRWRYEGNQTSVPRAVYGDPLGNARFSDRWIEDGSYIRLKNIVLSYNWELKRSFIENCTFFLTGENLLTFTRYKGLDPEFAIGQNPLYYGIDAGVVPQPKIVSIGVNLSL